MPILHCPVPQCIHKSDDGTCGAEVAELMFGIIMQLGGRGAECYMRCAQHMTETDLGENRRG